MEIVGIVVHMAAARVAPIPVSGYGSHRRRISFGGDWLERDGNCFAKKNSRDLLVNKCGWMNSAWQEKAGTNEELCVPCAMPEDNETATGSVDGIFTNGEGRYLDTFISFIRLVTS